MAIAIVEIQGIREDPNNAGNPTLDIAIFSLPTIGRGVSVPILAGDTVASVASKVVTAVVAAGASVGVVLARTDVLLPSFVRGS